MFKTFRNIIVHEEIMTPPLCLEQCMIRRFLVRRISRGTI